MTAIRLFIGRQLGSGVAKPVWFFVSLLPFCWLGYAAMADRLGANPAEALIRSTGDWTLRALCLVLAITPFRNATGWNALARFRRMSGLFVYFYALLHLLSYSWLDMGLELADIAKDIGKRPFILVGFTAWLLLTMLALTSFDRAIRWVGAARWKRLHRLVYAIAVLAVLHFFWMRAGKHNFAEVALYAAILGSLLLWRVGWWARKRAQQGRGPLNLRAWMSLRGQALTRPDVKR
jgi:sulfoxide reductase heme-binding subunit YedZ